MKTVLSLLISHLVVCSLASAGMKPELSDFDNAKMGMAKTEVLAELGSPHTSRRWKGQDRWEYHFYEKKGDLVVTVKKEILFKDGVVSYAGVPLTAKVSAEEQDKINLAADLNELEKWEAHKQKAVDSRTEYRKWVQQLHNKDPDPEATVPRFEPID